jgi:hypothetical protein
MTWLSGELWKWPGSSSSTKTEAGQALGSASECTRSQESRDTEASDFVTVQKLKAPTLPAGALCLTVCVDHCERGRAAAGSCGLFHSAARLPACQTPIGWLCVETAWPRGYRTKDALAGLGAAPKLFPAKLIARAHTFSCEARRSTTRRHAAWRTTCHPPRGCPRRRGHARRPYHR